MIDDRKSLILKAIIESFVQAADPVGSNYILKNYKINVSSATIRNDMAYLEEIGLIYQPHISAGRIPTEKGFRVFVDELMDEVSNSVQEKQRAVFDLSRDNTYREMEVFLKDSLSILSSTTQNVSFITLPWKRDAYYLGVSYVLKKPEFRDAVRASSIVEVLEDKDNFLEAISQMEIDRGVRIYIGNENIVSGIQSCSILVTEYELCDDFKGVIGVLGATRMNYAYNISALKVLRDDVERLCKKYYFNL